MKHTLSAILLLAGIQSAVAQEPIEGTVVYTRTLSYNFESTGNAEWDAYAKGLPKERRFEKVLFFTSEASLYDESTREKEADSQSDKKIEFFATYGKPPKPALKSLYINFQEESKTSLQEFMMREFLVESPMDNKGWKLDPTRKRIGDYVCMKATMMLEGDTVTAWFAPELPVPAGPAEYHGLPGVVLAVERLGETILLATTIDLSPPPADLLVKPESGKKISPEAFDRIVNEKVEEYKLTGSGKSEYYSK